MPADPNPCRARGGHWRLRASNRTEYLSPTKFLRVDFFCEQECDFFFVIYVNKVVLVFVFFYKMDCSRAQVQPNLREGDRPSQRAEPLQDMGASRIRGHVTILTHILLTSGW